MDPRLITPNMKKLKDTRMGPNTRPREPAPRGGHREGGEASTQPSSAAGPQTPQSEAAPVPAQDAAPTDSSAMQVDEDEIPPEQQLFREGDAAWEMVRDITLEISEFDPFLDPRNNVDPQTVAVRKLHYQPALIGEKETESPTDAAPQMSAPPTRNSHWEAWLSGRQHPGCCGGRSVLFPGWRFLVRECASLERGPSGRCA